MENKDIAKAVIEAIGGRDNVSSVAHCATRLRVMVKDEAKIDKDRVENLEKVQGAFFNSGQYQIIFGTGTVNKIYDEVVELGLPTSSTGEQKAEAAKKGNWFQVSSWGFVARLITIRFLGYLEQLQKPLLRQTSILTQLC